jgi:tRNA(Arg) A34 adenosine deaminase TadA
MSVWEVKWRLPQWAEQELASEPRDWPTVEQRMGWVIQMARRNVEQGTGGPFAAGIFERENGRLVACGVNQVMAQCSSAAHAEMLALALAQQRLGLYDLGGAGMPAYELVSSVEPCAMCLGAIPWSGVRYLVCGARDEDARAVGFDEGDKPAHWVEALERRGISVMCDVLREEAYTVLRQYQQSGGVIYNGGGGRIS